MNELEELVRETMRVMVTTVTEAPTSATVTRRPARRWLPAAAAALVVLTLGGATALWRMHGSGINEVGVGTDAAPITSCVAALPSAWTTALAAPPVHPTSGHSVPVGVTADGRTVVSWNVGGRAWFGSIAPGAEVIRPLFEVPADRDVETVDMDARTLVLSEVARARAAYGGPIEAVVTVDLHSGRAATILQPSAGQTLAGSTNSAAVIQDGVVYWSLLDTGKPGSASIEAFTVATGITRVIGHAPVSQPVVERGARGITWHGGGVPVTDLPRSASTATGVVASDGTAFAWQSSLPAATDPTRYRRRIVWTDAADDTRSVNVLSKQEIALVGGPFVLLATPSGSPVADGEPTDMHLLDVRTGALAAITIPGGYMTSADGHWALTARTGVLPIDTQHLPGLHC